MVNSIYDEALVFAYEATEGRQNEPFGFDEFFKSHNLGQMGQSDIYDHFVSASLARFLGGPILTLTHEGIVEAEQLLIDSEYSESIKQRETQRKLMFREVCARSGGPDLPQIDLWKFGQEIGLTPPETEQTYLYLCGENLIEPRGAGFFQLTLHGYRNQDSFLT